MYDKVKFEEQYFLAKHAVLDRNKGFDHLRVLKGDVVITHLKVLQSSYLFAYMNIVFKLGRNFQLLCP